MEQKRSSYFHLVVGFVNTQPMSLTIIKPQKPVPQNNFDEKTEDIFTDFDKH